MTKNSVKAVDHKLTPGHTPEQSHTTGAWYRKPAIHINPTVPRRTPSTSFDGERCCDVSPDRDTPRRGRGKPAPHGYAPQAAVLPSSRWL